MAEAMAVSQDTLMLRIEYDTLYCEKEASVRVAYY